MSKPLPSGESVLPAYRAATTAVIAEMRELAPGAAATCPCGLGPEGCMNACLVALMEGHATTFQQQAAAAYIHESMLERAATALGLDIHGLLTSMFSSSKEKES